MRHVYTDPEIALIRRLHPTHTAEQLSAAIFGTPRRTRSIYNLLWRIGLKKVKRLDADVHARIRTLIREGRTDSDVARQVGCSRQWIAKIRSDKLKLPVNGEAIHAAKLRGVEAQKRTLGITNPAELRSRAYRRYAVENGWPEDLRPREVQVLNCLAAAGVPMSRLEIAAKIGMRTDLMGGNNTLDLLRSNSKGGTCTAALIRRGLVSALKRAAVVHGQGKGKSRDLYLLGPAALAILEERARCVPTVKTTA